MNVEQWVDVPGFGGRYEVSDAGRVRAKACMQRFVSKRGNEAFRHVGPMLMSQQRVNSGYLVVHLSHQYKRKAITVHRLVATAFCSGAAEGLHVNHKDGNKSNNLAANLEWVTCSDNHFHAVETGLRSDAIRVTDPRTGVRYPSISQAARATGVDHHRISKEWRGAA